MREIFNAINDNVGLQVLVVVVGSPIVAAILSVPNILLYKVGE